MIAGRMPEEIMVPIAVVPHPHSMHSMLAKITLHQL